MDGKSAENTTSVTFYVFYAEDELALVEKFYCLFLRPI